jgi:hypothetical protein
MESQAAADDMDVVAAVPGGRPRVGGLGTPGTYTDEEHSCSADGRCLS